MYYQTWSEQAVQVMTSPSVDSDFGAVRAIELISPRILSRKTDSF